MAVRLRIRAGSFRELAIRLRKIGERYTDLSEPLELVGIRLQGTREEIFERGGDPRRWVPSKRALRDRGQTLVDTRALLNSITTRTGEGSLFDVRPRRVEVGTLLRYGLIHQKGGVIRIQRRFSSRVFATVTIRIPKREYLNLRRSDIRAIIEVIESWQKGLFSEVTA